MIKHYYYNQQLKKFIIGFSNVFAGLKVRTGRDRDGNITELDVPVRYGSSDRVTAAIATGNTQNNLHTLPIMSTYMSALNLAPERMHGVNQVDRRTYLEQGGVFPDDVKAIQRVMAIPYNMEMELSIYASNSDQLFQILEQIMILFDYDLQIQFNDAAFDWTKITKVTLTGMQNEETYPAGVDKRMLVWSLQFEVPVWLSPPVEIRREIVNQIAIRIADTDALVLNEVDQDGNLIPFDQMYDEFTVTKPNPVVEDPDVNHASPGGVTSPGSGGPDGSIRVNAHYDPSTDDNCAQVHNNKQNSSLGRP